MLSWSIRQGCPLAPSLFVIAYDALFYLLRDDSLSSKVAGIRLPDDNELMNIQFYNDTAIFLELSKQNMDNLILKIQIFGSIFGARISHSKSTFLSWKVHPPDWFGNFGYQWGGPSKIVRYLGVPFSLSPSLKDMWLWVKEKIVKKLNKWNNRLLSLAGRVQVYKKIMSSYNIYYSSTWMLSNYQIFVIQKMIRCFLWSDGNVNNKLHVVKWSWCHNDKGLSGLDLKDLRTQGISLVAKWIFHAFKGWEPWKFLIRSKIERVVPKKAKSWKGLPFIDLLAKGFPISIQGSCIFRYIWKSWEQVRGFVGNTSIYNGDLMYGEGSLWWNLFHAGKLLALTQGCLARNWASKGIKYLIYVIEHDTLISWEDLSSKFNLPPCPKKNIQLD